MDIQFEAKVCHVGFSIGYFSKEYLISWADKVILTLDTPDIPTNVFDLSMVKKVEDIPRLLLELSQDIHEDKVLKTIVGMISHNYENKQLSLYETCEYLYRLSNYVDSDHLWNRHLYVITGNLEVALDGYGDVGASLAEVEDFLKEHEGFTKLFDPVFVPERPKLTEFKLKKDKVVIDVSRVLAASDLQLVLKNELDFPECYGMNWSAFWDAITAMVKLPRKITFSGWEILNVRFPEEAKILEGLFKDYTKNYARENFVVEYE